MYTSKNITVLLLAITSLSGCSFVPASLKSKSYNDFSIEPLTKNVSDFTGKCSKGETSGLDCETNQNTAIMKVLVSSNKQCVNHLSTIYGNDAAFNISTGTTAIFTSGWAAISSGGQAKLLSALSTFANGERSLVNETVYKNMLTTSIGIKISEMRETKGNAIRSKIGKDDYMAAQAEYDLIDYHNSCSFYVGLQQALKEGTNTNPELKRNQLEVKRQTLINQIMTYAKSNDIKDLKESDKNNKDPIYKSLVDDLASMNAELSAMKSSSAQVSDKSIDTSTVPTAPLEKNSTIDKTTK